MIVSGQGPRPAPVMVVGEQPGEWEARTGIPFHPKAAVGSELTRYLRQSLGLERSEVFLTNLVCDYQKNREITKGDIAKWEKQLAEDLATVKPRLILALGREATRWFLGDVHLEDVYALPQWPMVNCNGAVVVPMHLRLYDSEVQPLVWYAFEQGRRILSGEIVPHERTLSHPADFYYRAATASPDVRWLDGSDEVAVDTEGLPGKPWGLSFSAQSQVAHVIRLEDREAMVVFKDAIRKSRIIMHNALFDLGMLREMGIAVQEFDDTMVMAFLLGLEPLGLKALAYRYRGIARKSYEEVIRPAAETLAMEWLERAATIDWGPATEELIFEPDRVRIYHPHSLNQRIDHIVGVRVGEIMVTGPRTKKAMTLLKRELEGFGVHVGTYNAGHTGWHDCRVPSLAFEKMKSLYGKDYLWDFESREVKQDASTPDPGKRWQAVCRDMPELTDAVERILGPLPEAGLDSVEAVFHDKGRELATRYSAGDADDTWTIYPLLKRQIEELELEEVYRLDMAVLPMVERMMRTGFQADGDYFQALGRELGLEMERVAGEIEHIVGHTVNPNSSKQVAALLFKKLRLPVQQRTESGEPSTADEVIEALRLVSDHPVLAHISDYRELAKMKGTYADKLWRWLGDDGRIHPKLRLTRVPSGRLACSEPNLMAIPVRSERILGAEKLGIRIRKGFVAGVGHVLGSWDFDQIEMRCLAHRSEDPNLIEVFESGADIHKKTASLVFDVPVDQVEPWQRTSAKSVGFGIVYGVTAKGLALQMKLRGIDRREDECQAMIDSYLRDAYPKVKSLMEDKKAEARRYGYVRSMLGRIRYLPAIHSTNKRLRAESERIALNHDIQTTAQEIIKLAMAGIWSRVLPAIWAEGWYCEPLLQIHDEIVMECDEKIAPELDALVRTELENAIRLKVPLGAKGHYATNWGGLK